MEGAATASMSATSAAGLENGANGATTGNVPGHATTDANDAATTERANVTNAGNPTFPHQATCREA
eukprot:10775863-Ditylum_brightwellii.AAC.1